MLVCDEGVSKIEVEAVSLAVFHLHLVEGHQAVSLKAMSRGGVGRGDAEGAGVVGEELEIIGGVIVKYKVSVVGGYVLGCSDRVGHDKERIFDPVYAHAG